MSSNRKPQTMASLNSQQGNQKSSMAGNSSHEVIQDLIDRSQETLMVNNLKGITESLYSGCQPMLTTEGDLGRSFFNNPGSDIQNLISHEDDHSSEVRLHKRQGSSTTEELQMKCLQFRLKRGHKRMVEPQFPHAIHRKDLVNKLKPPRQEAPVKVSAPLFNSQLADETSKYARNFSLTNYGSKENPKPPTAEHHSQQEVSSTATDVRAQSITPTNFQSENGFTVHHVNRARLNRTLKARTSIDLNSNKPSISLSKQHFRKIKNKIKVQQIASNYESIRMKSLSKNATQSLKISSTVSSNGPYEERSNSQNSIKSKFGIKNKLLQEFDQLIKDAIAVNKFDFSAMELSLFVETYEEFKQKRRSNDPGQRDRFRLIFKMFKEFVQKKMASDPNAKKMFAQEAEEYHKQQLDRVISLNASSDSISFKTKPRKTIRLVNNYSKTPLVSQSLNMRTPTSPTATSNPNDPGNIYSCSYKFSSQGRNREVLGYEQQRKSHNALLRTRSGNSTKINNKLKANRPATQSGPRNRSLWRQSENSFERSHYLKDPEIMSQNKAPPKWSLSRPTTGYLSGSGNIASDAMILNITVQSQAERFKEQFAVEQQTMRTSQEGKSILPQTIASQEDREEYFGKQEPQITFQDVQDEVNDEHKDNKIQKKQYRRVQLWQAYSNKRKT